MRQLSTRLLLEFDYIENAELNCLSLVDQLMRKDNVNNSGILAVVEDGSLNPKGNTLALSCATPLLTM